MKRLIAVALLCAIALSFASTADATAIRYKTVGPVMLRTGWGATTGFADSAARNFNTACVGGSVDTSVAIIVGNDIVWGAVSDSIPIIVMVERIGGTGGVADSVQVALQASFAGTGSASYLPSYTDTGNDWGASTFALIGAGTGGIVRFTPATTSVVLEAALGSRHIFGPAWGATSFRILARSISVAASAGRFSVFLRYPVMVD